MRNDKLNNSYLTFVIDDKTFAIPLLAMHGVSANPEIFRIINADKFVTGCFYVNDSIAPILDLRTLLNKPDRKRPNKTGIIIVRVSFKGQEKLVGLIIDSLRNIYDIQSSDIENLSSYDNKEFIDGVTEQSGRMILFLNLAKIINESDVIYFLNRFWNLENPCNDKNNRRNKNGV